MKTLLVFLLLLSVITAVSGIIIGDGDGYAGGWSSSSEEYGHGHGHGHGRPPRPPGPRPPRPPATSECPSDWMTFNRPQGTWCVKVFYGDLNQFNSETMCQAFGATLTGLQNADERMQIANAGRLLAAQHGGGFADIWLGGKRKARCPTRPSCTPNDTFEWTDGHTTGTAGFHYPGNEPNNHGWQNCLELHTSVANGVAARYGYSHGDLDDQHCTTAEKMYACGKLPS